MASRRPARFQVSPVRDSERQGTGMADLAYVLLIIGGFALLAIMLRGLERL